MYARFIDYLRKLVVFTFFASVFGMFVAYEVANSREWFTLFAVIAGVDCLAAVPLVIEYVIRSYFEARPNGVQKYQFSLLELFAATTLFAVLLSCYKLLGNTVWPLGLSALVVVAYIVEVHRRKSGATVQNPSRDLAAPPTHPSSEATTESKATQNEHE
jgi:hypothetical protein